MWALPMSDVPTPPAAKKTAQKNGRHEGGQVQGGNAQEGRRLRNRKIAIPRCSNMLEGPVVRKRETHFGKLYPPEMREKPDHDLEFPILLPFCDILCAAK